MTALAFEGGGFLAGRGSPAAGPVGRHSVAIARKARLHGKDLPARSSWSLNDLDALAVESASTVADPEVFCLARQFLHALPSSLPSPELALDSEGDVVFDWCGSAGRMLTVALKADGQISYACRVSAYDKEHGIKRFQDAVPKELVDCIQKVSF